MSAGSGFRDHPRRTDRPIEPPGRWGPGLGAGGGGGVFEMARARRGSHRVPTAREPARRGEPTTSMAFPAASREVEASGTTLSRGLASRCRRVIPDLSRDQILVKKPDVRLVHVATRSTLAARSRVRAPRRDGGGDGLGSRRARPARVARASLRLGSGVGLATSRPAPRGLARSVPRAGGPRARDGDGVGGQQDGREQPAVPGGAAQGPLRASHLRRVLRRRRAVHQPRARPREPDGAHRGRERGRARLPGDAAARHALRGGRGRRLRTNGWS